jgi:hypothetical protein
MPFTFGYTGNIFALAAYYEQYMSQFSSAQHSQVRTPLRERL